VGVAARKDRENVLIFGVGGVAVWKNKWKKFENCVWGCGGLEK
jgi:hypothetical protein